MTGSAGIAGIDLAQALGIVIKGDDALPILCNVADFSVKDGVVRCVPAMQVVFQAGGVDYAVNGMAMSWADRNGYEDVDAIWRDDPKFKGLKISIGPIIEAGLELCD